jgi:poly(ADP-ribose) glycohydrolase ARH3
MPSLVDRFRGCLLGLAVGDALGGRFEAQSAESLRQRFRTIESLINHPDDELWYTDDTQMTIGVAETLVAHASIVESELCSAFVANYVPSRGYGRGSRAVLEAMEEGGDYRRVAEKYFPGGSLGNGAAMRVAPVGLFFHDDPDKLREQARLSALPTHLQALAIEGAQILALAVSLCVRSERFDRIAFLSQILRACELSEYRAAMQQVIEARSSDDLARLGNGIEALQSVPTAIAAFSLAPDSYSQAIGSTILLGGDTDTLAAMTGALSGGYLGLEGIPKRLLNLLEKSPKGYDYLMQLADGLYTACKALRQ